MVPLSSFVTIEHTAGPEFTNRYNLFRSAEITGTAAPGFSSGQAMKALEEVAREVLSSDYSYAWTALSYQEANAPSPVPTFVLALVVVFLILAALYESWSLPLSVLLGAAPVAAFCAFLALFVTQDRVRRLLADRSHHAGRALVQERDPHRGVREGASRGGQVLPGRSGRRSIAFASVPS